jgi:hypothetical protein
VPLRENAEEKKPGKNRRSLRKKAFVFELYFKKNKKRKKIVCVLCENKEKMVCGAQRQRGGVCDGEKIVHSCAYDMKFTVTNPSGLLHQHTQLSKTQNRYAKQSVVFSSDL